ncbi:MAG TPA: 3-phosphoshikimate 1-carboxyvinyltransferase [Vicinamibacterales bacterium]|nr:3-phosphoshikimate 1-carboxyvinyltransferase [Vicinamibacterales bacterium]
MLRASVDAALVHPAQRASGRLQVPGDKSISHRYALLGAIAEGVTRITGYSSGADCAATLACLRALGVPIARDGGRVEITGRGLHGLTEAAAPVDAANSGTTMRLLAGLAAAHPFRTVIVGDASLTRRPMRRVMAPLTQMGATIHSDDGRPPLTIDGARLHGITYRPDVPSAQVKSSVLLAGLHASGRTTVIEPAATRDHTERALSAFGVTVDRDGLQVSVAGGQTLSARTLQVPGDVSGSAFWGALAAGLPDSLVQLDNLGLNPSRIALLDILRRCGAQVDVVIDSEAAGEPMGRVTISCAERRSFSITPEEVPAVIDELPALGALGTLLPDGSTMEVRGAAELRVKESDRISALAAGFRAMGAEITEYPDGFRIDARPLRGGTTVDAVGDHRLAMAFAIAACGASAPTTIAGAGAVDVSYPGFFLELERLTMPGAGR